MALTRSAAVAAWSRVAPAAIASADAHVHRATANEAVPVSTTRTGTGASPAARWAAFTVPDTDEPMWTDRISVAPPSASRWYTSAKRPGLGWDVDTSGDAPCSKRE